MSAEQTMQETKVRIMVGAEAAYACITTPTTSLDVRLDPGMSASKAMLRSAKELREQAERLLKRAELIETAEKLV